MFEEKYSLVAMKNGSVDLETSLPETSGENMESMLLLEKYRIVECEDSDCPDYGKLIEVFDGIYRGFPFHMERIDGVSYNLQIKNNIGIFGLTRREVNKIMSGPL